MRSRDMENLRTGLALIREKSGSFIVNYDSEGEMLVIPRVDLNQFPPSALRELYELGFTIQHDFDCLPEGCTDDPLQDILLWAGFKRLLLSNKSYRDILYDLK